MTDTLDAPADEAVDPTKQWHPTSCVLCSANCGLEVRIDGRDITRVRGNKAHVGSQGYTCEKGLRVNHYQNAQGRLTSPMKRLPDGRYVEVDWDTAIAEVAAGFQGVISRHGGDKIMYYGGGGQGNHLCGAHGAATMRALGITRRSNALAQEKTGEAWVEGRMFGTHTHGHFADAEVSVFLGKNAWHSHGFDQARRVLKEIAADDSRSMIVIDPRRTETADLADYFLQVKPGRDAQLLAAMIGVVVDEGLTADSFLAENSNGVEETLALFRGLPITDLAESCGVDEDLIRAASRRIASTRSVAVYEDLGIEMAPNSTMISYLQRVLWNIVGAYGAPGGMSAHSSMISLFNYSAAGNEPADPVTGSPIISGLAPCNEVADGILGDHPERIRALFIESANPVHSLAESDKFRRAMRECEFSVVIDPFMTETAEHADYVLPAATQYEKVETTFFGTGFPDNWFCLRPPLFEPLGDSLPEPEIHSRIIRALGVYTDDDLAPLREAAGRGEEAFGAAFMAAMSEKPHLAGVGSVVLYETLGQTLPNGMEGAAAMWFAAHQTAMKYPEAVKRAGIDGDGLELGSNLFHEMVTNPDGVIFTRHEHEDSWALLGTSDKKINLAIPDLFDDIRGLLDQPTYTSDEFPYVLSAGERRSFTANTIMRDPEWRKRDKEGALRLSPGDAAAIGVAEGDRVRITTPGGTAVAVAEVNDTMMDGHVALPNGLGLSYSPAGGNPEITGVAPNELTTTDWCDPIAKTPWHKHVPARLEPVER